MKLLLINNLVIASFLIINLIIYFNLDRLSKVINIYDTPDKKLKLHRKITPVLGGCILAINYFFLFFYQIYLGQEFLAFKKSIFSNREIISIIILIISLFLIGIYDDKFKIKPSFKIFYSTFVLLLCILINEKLVISSFSVSFLKNKIFLNQLSFFFTIFSFLIFINSLNFFDGINGQSCLFLLIVFVFLLLKSNFHLFYIFNIFLILLIFFLNIKEKIFLGDSGIFLIGSVASISLIYEYKFNQFILFADQIFLLLLLPGIDLVRLTIVRIYNGKNAFYGDRNHIHHLLMKKFSLKLTNIILVFVSILPTILFLYLNFYLSFSLFLIIYILLILKLK